MAVLGIGERLDQCEKFKNRTRPAVDQQQGYGVGTGRALMNKINLLSINFRGELVKTVDLRFLRAPVVAVLPILREFPDLFDVGTVFPCRTRKLIGPFGFRQAAPKINEDLVRNVCFERANCGRLRICQYLRLPKRKQLEQKQRGQQKLPALRGLPFSLLESCFHNFHALQS